jgi:hypothetical protein
MLNLKTLAFTAMIGLGAWALAATIGLGALAVASSVTPVDPNAQSIGARQIDTVDLMSKAGNLPVDVAPAP